MSNTEVDFIEDESQREIDDDFVAVDDIKFSQAVVSGNDWTTETILNQINKGNIQLNPDFQRRDAWDKIRKSRFIESLILGLPVPQVVLAESKDRRGAYIVLDGKQRLLAIRQFAATDNDGIYERLKLTSPEIRIDLKGKSLVDLKGDIEYLDDLSSFENQPIRTVVIKNWPNENFLYHVFLRLNTGSVSLSPQELRQALHPGPFVTFIDQMSSESNALREILKLRKPDFRMRDAELLLRYYAFKNFLETYTGSLKLFLDNCCLKLNKSWESRSSEIENQLEEFEKAHIAIKRIFNNHAYRKWSSISYENRFNRSIFDIMVLSFTDSDVREKSVGREDAIEGAFKELCRNDKAFLHALETTTKSLSATYTRISKWNQKLNGVLEPVINFKRVPPQRSLTSRLRKPEYAAPLAFRVIVHSHGPGGETATSTRNFAPPPIGVVTGRSLS